ncbi:hypothetical protein [Streptomyces sp. KS 21]|uniref:hypothetical protein n=1 Tax=Streptomyces sp. KS 21 TaxID=2485150 RepID=UPI001AAE2C58|nr:hypothetical protein [Streptomyces sp. KS 21]
MERRATFGDTTAVISDGTTTYIFCTAESFTARNWPSDELVFRLDLAYDDVEAAEQHLLAARPGQPSPCHQPGSTTWTVLPPSPVPQWAVRTVDRRCPASRSR